jgi:hypothetical protein
LYLVLYAGGIPVMFISFSGFHLVYTTVWIAISYLGIAMMLARTRPEGSQAA